MKVDLSEKSFSPFTIHQRPHDHVSVNLWRFWSSFDKVIIIRRHDNWDMVNTSAGFCQLDFSTGMQPCGNFNIGRYMHIR
eukprot:10627881-Karenia_brevis.AAC.1